MIGSSLLSYLANDKLHCYELAVRLIPTAFAIFTNMESWRVTKVTGLTTICVLEESNYMLAVCPKPFHIA
ncbi:hypothetical protein CFP56_025589 [Quercus suber]|uniref:Uncharacterized protein n=1 Tax=Quercus suber TaxID=58331 RepID=A0AAW0K2Q3_QUESU